VFGSSDPFRSCLGFADRARWELYAVAEEIAARNWNRIDKAPKGRRGALKRIAAALVTLCFASAASAQQVPPYTYPQTIGTSSVTVLSANPARKKIIFHNPNDSAKIAVCPVGPTRVAFGSASLIVAAINGAGCITILPYDRVEISGSTASGPQQSMGSAWVGIASAGGSAFTVLEFE
jgi:hypothetical protein